MKKIITAAAVILALISVCVLFIGCDKKNNGEMQNNTQNSMMSTTDTRPDNTNKNSGIVTDVSQKGKNGVAGELASDAGEMVSDIADGVSEGISDITH